MKNINLFDGLLEELYKIFKSLEIDYVYKIYTSENGTVLCCYTGEKHILFIHKEMNDLYHSAYSSKSKLDHSCVSQAKKVLDSRNYYLSYNGIGNFKVINGEDLQGYYIDEKNVINIVLFYDRSMPDLFFELLMALHYYKTHDGKNFSSVMRPDFTSTEVFFDEIRRISLHQYTYPGFTKGEFIDTLWHLKEKADFYRNFSPDLLHVIDYYASNRCNDLIGKRIGGVRALLTSGHIPVSNPAIMAINVKRMNGEKIDERLHPMKLGCIYGIMPHHSHDIIIDDPYLKFKNDPNKEFIFIDSKVFVEIAELMQSLMSVDRESRMNRGPIPYDEKLESIIKYGLHDNISPLLRKKFYKSVLQKVLEWIEEIKLSPYRIHYINKLANSIDYETNIYLQRILYNIKKNVSEEIRVYIEEMIHSLRENLSTSDKNFPPNALSKCSSSSDIQELFFKIWKGFSKNDTAEKSGIYDGHNSSSSSGNLLDKVVYTPNSSITSSRIREEVIYMPSFSMRSSDIIAARISDNLTNVTTPYETKELYNYYVPITVLGVLLVLPVIIKMFITFLRQVFKSMAKEKNNRTIVIDPEVIPLDYYPRR